MYQRKGVAVLTIIITNSVVQGTYTLLEPIKPTSANMREV